MGFSSQTGGELVTAVGEGSCALSPEARVGCTRERSIEHREEGLSLVCTSPTLRCCDSDIIEAIT